MKTALGSSDKTITDWTNYLRESVTTDVLMNDECVIGGPGIHVEIDVSKFGKQKCHVSIDSAFPKPIAREFSLPFVT